MVPWRSVLLVGVLLTAGCRAGTPAVQPSRPPAPTASSTPTPTAVARPMEGYAATAVGAGVDVHAAPGGARLRRLDNPQPSGAPLTFLLKTEQPQWLEVFLPVRPNGSTGWVRRSDVRLSSLRYRVDVLRGAHRLHLVDRGLKVREFPVGIGTGETPTPGGVFYLKELIEPTNDGGFYGPYAYGLSGFSTVLSSFAGGEGVIGLHGTNDPGSIGKDVSHGCIRMHNADITYLASLLPLGTPVRILA